MSDANSRIAVAILTHNRRSEVLCLLERLTSLPEKPAIVLVDNASTDGTAAAVAIRYPQVEIVRAKKNLGAAGRNLALLRIDAPYVALSDDDTWWEPGSLALASELFDAHPRLAVATARVLVGEEEELDPTCLVMEASPLAPGERGKRRFGGFLRDGVISSNHNDLAAEPLGSEPRQRVNCGIVRMRVRLSHNVGMPRLRRWAARASTPPLSPTNFHPVRLSPIGRP